MYCIVYCDRTEVGHCLCQACYLRQLMMKRKCHLQILPNTDNREQQLLSADSGTAVTSLGVNIATRSSGLIVAKRLK